MRIDPQGRIEVGSDAVILDRPGEKHEAIVLSHAHADHAVRKGHILASPETARLMEVRYGVKDVEIIDYKTPRSIGSMTVTLLPSGHILGSSQVLVETAQTSLLYSGDIKLRQGYSCRPINIPRAEHLILEATFGKHTYQWPRQETIENQVFDFIAASQGEGYVPVFLAYSLGKSQELLALMARRKVRVWVSKTVYQMSKVYEEFGISLGNYEPYADETYIPGVLVIPSQKAKYLRVKNPHFATVSGWAVSRRFNRGAFQIPLSDHADFGELLRYVDKVSPRKVWTTHGFARELASALRHRGYDARPLSEVGSGLQLSFT